MVRTGERQEQGQRFAVGMASVLCALAGLLALFGVPAAGGIFAGYAGIVAGFAAARVLVPRKSLGLPAKMLVALMVLGGMLFGGFYFEVFDFSSGRGALAFGLYFGFSTAAASRLFSEPRAPERADGR